MIPEIGNLALTFGLALALIQFVFPLYGLATNRWRLVLLARPAAIGQFLFMALAFACLAWSFYINDFTVNYVALHSNRSLPVPYRLGATWGGHEGSLLLWAFILSSWTVAVALLSRSLPALTRARVLAILGGVALGFISFIVFTSNPFDRLLPIFPIDGNDLNPLLQDPGMVFHPPLLYMGYVGFSVAFAFSISALLEGRIDALWARWVRPWTLAAWMFLTLGITAGSWWAYNELGWGGWWFWDPVENASFMPWLVGTALLHSLAATEKRGVFKAWTTLLAIAAFSFSLLGTFLVRSGVLTSVHAFANDPVRGAYILVFLGVVVGFSLLLFALRASTVSTTSWFGWLSRETLILLNNLILVVAAIMILLGTLQPIIADLFKLGKISVGAPYFNLVFTSLMAPLLFLVGLGPVVYWRQFGLPALVSRCRNAFIAASIMGLIVVVLSRGQQYGHEFSDLLQIFLGVFLATWIIVLNAADLVKATVLRRGIASMKISPSRFAMHLAHVGLAIVVIGVVLTSHLSEEKNIRLGVGQTYDLGGYTFKFDAMNNMVGANYTGLRGVFTVYKNNKMLTRLNPEKRRYNASGQWMTEAGIHTNLRRDLYIALGEKLPNSDDWAVRVYVKPYVFCLWLGGILMGLAGFISIADKRYRKKSKAAPNQLVANQQVSNQETDGKNNQVPELS